MFEPDLAAFSGILDTTLALYSRAGFTPNGAQTALWFRALSGYTLAEVRAALDAHVRDPQRGRFAPVPADVIGQIESQRQPADDRPGGDEAWAIAIKAADECNTLVWTQEIAEAWSIAKPVFLSRDEVGARMAFRDAYARLVIAAQHRNEPPNWQVSLGHDPELRPIALDAGVKANRLSPQHDALPAPAGKGILELLESSATASACPPEIRTKLLKFRDEMAKRMSSPLPSPDAIERQRTADLKAEVKRRVEGRLGTGDNPSVEGGVDTPPADGDTP